MKQNEFNLIDAALREGLDVSRLSLVEDVESTRSYYGTDVDRKLDGKWLVVYVSYGEAMPYLDRFVADYEMTLEDYPEQYLRIFSLNG